MQVWDIFPDNRLHEANLKIKELTEKLDACTKSHRARDVELAVLEERVDALVQALQDAHRMVAEEHMESTGHGVEECPKTCDKAKWIRKTSALIAEIEKEGR